MSAYLDAGVRLPAIIEEPAGAAPDALHAAVCRRLGLTLVTLDRRLGAAARELGLDVRIPS